MKAYQTSRYGVPLKHLGIREFTTEQWEKLMDFYKRKGLKPRWVLVKEEKPRRRKKEELPEVQEDTGGPQEVQEDKPKIENNEEERSRT